MIKKQFFILIIFTLFSVGAFAQTQSAYIRAADDAFETKSYYAALVYYQEAVAFDESNIDLRYKLAESSRKFMSYDLAEQNYKFVKDNDSENKYPLATYFLGEVLQKQGKYEESKEQYDLYLTENSGDDEYYTYKADKERKASEWAATEIDSPDETITVNNLGSNINTVYSDFAPSIKEKELFFSSMKFQDPSSKDQRVSKVQKSTIPDDMSSSIGNPMEIADGINVEGTNTGNTAFNKDKSKIFYTVCDRLNESEIRCDLYCKMINEDGSFGTGEKLPAFVNAEGFTSTHPTIGYDKATDKEILYFASDRTGGKGKLDIYYSIIDNKNNFTKPMNLESINTKDDELTPFFHIPSSTLYFSSDGYRSFGGYDVYSSLVKGSKYGEPVHLNNPLNSSYHDIYFVLGDDEEYGYFATNREGAQFIDNIQKACCFDIYKVKFEPLELNLNALTYDKISKADLIGATVKLINDDTGELIGEITNTEGIDHNFELDRCTNYLIVGQKEGYKSDTIRYSTCGLKKSEDITKKLFLEPDLLEIDVFTFDEKTKNSLIGSTVVLTDLSTPNAEPLIITNAQANDFTFTLVRGHKYTVSASNPGYYPASVDIITENIAGTKITKNLYLRKDPVAYANLRLPVKLYFDNDRPNPRTTRRTTTKTYTDTYVRYIKRRNTFIERCDYPDRVTNFFDGEVAPGYSNFLDFLSVIQPVLAKGEIIEITVKGHASPLSQTNYNLFLGQRRISSVMNELRQYGGGVLLPYLDSGQLKITDISYGETLSPKDISDDRKNTRASIYSAEASRERRVEIIDVTRQQN